MIKMKKGFTLVELLAVIVVMGIIATIGYAAVSGVINSSKQSSYELQVKNIEKAVKQWAVENTNLLPDIDGEKYTLTLDVLKSSGILQEIPTDPRSGEPMKGNIIIEFNSSTNQYTYDYNESADDKVPVTPS